MVILLKIYRNGGEGVSSIFRQIMVFFLIVVLTVSSINASAYTTGQAGGGPSMPQYTTDKQAEGFTSSAAGPGSSGPAEATTGKDMPGTSQAEPGNREPEGGDSGTGDTEEQEGSTEEGKDDEEADSDEDGEDPEKESSESGTEEDDGGVEVDWDEAVDDSPVFRLKAASSNHKVTMPDLTSHYFLLQKESSKVSSASGKNLKISSGIEEASRYIFSEYSADGKYNFTPTFTSSTTVKIGGGDGGKVDLSTLKKGTHAHYGDLSQAASNGELAECGFNLNKASSDPYAIYTNVGTWYDPATSTMSAVDLKLTVEDWLYPPEEVRKQLSNKSLDAAYAGFRKDEIGVVMMATDTVSLRMDFYYAGTDRPVSGLCGFVQCGDVDAQQGLDFGKGFEKVVMFDTAASHLAYHAAGLTGSSIGYVSSRTAENLEERDTNTTVVGIFSGSTISMVFTLAKCDQKDTGGSAEYGVSDGYGVPADSSFADAFCYQKSNSTGLVTFRNDLAFAPLPPAPVKGIIKGGTDGDKSLKTDRVLTLDDRKSIFTYAVTGAVPTMTDTGRARYEAYTLSDTIDSLLEVEKVEIYSLPSGGEGGNSRTTDYFNVTEKEGKDHETVITASAKDSALADPSFYGQSYSMQIQVRIRTDKELSSFGKKLSDWYRKDNSLASGMPEGTETAGKAAVSNEAALTARTSQGGSVKKKTPPVLTLVPPVIRVRKVDEKTKKPVKGVRFGLFGGADVTDRSEKNAIATAVTDDKGLAVFIPGGKGTFYEEAYGDGPYCIKEISVPDSRKNVWDSTKMTKWVYTIESLKQLMPEDNESAAAVTMENSPLRAEKGYVKVYKKCSDTGQLVGGARFILSCWSEEKKSYEDLFELKEEKDEKGNICYVNPEALENSLDNPGRYRIRETGAPEGCVNEGDSWTFTLSGKDGPVYKSEKSGKEQKDSLTVTDPLQKGILVIHKTDEEGKEIAGAVFSVTAAEDIYAPWDIDNEGKPLNHAKVLTAKGTVCDEITTAENGEGKSTKGKELYPGKYEVKETRAPKGHLLSDRVYEAEVRRGTEDTESFTVCRMEATNRRIRPSFSVSKLADKTRNADGGPVAYDKDLGRYSQKKIPGSYEGGSKVSFTLRITNTGNVPLYHLSLTEDMSKSDQDGKKSLAEYADISTAAYELPVSGIMTTVGGKKTKVSVSKDDPLHLDIASLAEGDSLEVVFSVKLRKDAADVFDLLNRVSGRAAYKEEGEDSDKFTAVPTEDLIDPDGRKLTEDEDHINIPGKGDLTPVKKADRTTGITIKDGSVTGGSKVAGIYQSGEEIRFTIMVKNTGTAGLRKILVKDVMSDELAAVTDPESRGFVTESVGGSKAETASASGARISLKQTGKDEILLCDSEYGSGKDLLAPGDYVTLTYKATILRDVGGQYDLANKVTAAAFYYDGKQDVPVKEKEDKDKIHIPGLPMAKAAKLADRTRGAVLKEGRYGAGTKITGTYQSGDKVRYKITVTNSGSASLYSLKLTEKMSDELLGALDADSIAFEEKEYTSGLGRKVRSSAEKDHSLILDFLAPGDSVDVFMTADVRKGAGNLFELENRISLTAAYNSGLKKGQGSVREAQVTEGFKDLPSAKDRTDKAVDKMYDTIRKMSFDQALEYAGDFEDIPVTDLMTDTDHISIPGLPEAAVAKIADRTTGAEFSGGRWQGNRTAGTYEYGEDVDYSITVTNKGTADLYEILISDTPEEELDACLVKDSLRFTTGKIKSEAGDDLVLSEAESSGDSSGPRALLDHLKRGDSVCLHLTGKVKTGVAAREGLNNVVEIAAKYMAPDKSGRLSRTFVEETDEMKDEDRINIGLPDLRIAKLADKTGGVSLVGGRYSGSRNYGTYKSGEKVTISLLVTNTGSARANHVSLTEKPEEAFSRYLDIKGFTLKAGDTVTSEKGEKLTVEEAERDTLTLDRLDPEDSVSLTWEATVKKNLKVSTELINEAEVTGKNKDGSPIPETPEMTDEDHIRLKATPQKKAGRKGTSSVGPKTGDPAKAKEYLLSAALALFLLIALFLIRGRKEN